MSQYFVSPEDLGKWIKSRPTADEAAKEFIGIIGGGGKDVKEEDDIVSTCRSVFNGKDENASSVLFGILAKHNITQLKKEAQSQPSQSRQRNGWVRGMRNKWNRCVDGFNDGTPWRIDRDKMYNFTHYYTDAITFDEDPTRVYSGEAIWRSYIMDKYSREYQDKNGHWVGGYINDRFYVFPDAGTPANPKVARDGGNQMGLAPGERTRKPRPHQWSTERRLEDGRGNNTYDIEVTTCASSNKPIAKIASANLPKERDNDNIYNIFRDTIEMREAGFEYEDMIKKIADHYDATLTGVAQIDAYAQRLIAKHSGVFYRIEKTAEIERNLTFEVVEELPIIEDGIEKTIHPGTKIVSLSGNRFKIIDDALNDEHIKNVFSFVGIVPENKLKSLDESVGGEKFAIQDAADETGLNDNEVLETAEVTPTTTLGPTGEDFPVNEI